MAFYCFTLLLATTMLFPILLKGLGERASFGTFVAAAIGMLYGYTATVGFTVFFLLHVILAMVSGDTTVVIVSTLFTMGCWTIFIVHAKLSGDFDDQKEPLYIIGPH